MSYIISYQMYDCIQERSLIQEDCHHKAILILQNVIIIISMIIFNNILQLQNRIQTLPLKNVIFILEVEIKTPLWLDTTYYINVRETRRGITN